MGDADDAKVSAWAVYGRLLSYIKPVLGFFLLAVAGNILYALSSAAMAPAMKLIVEAIEAPTAENRLLVPLFIVGVFSLRGLGAFAGTYCMTRVGREIVHKLRTQLFDHMLRLPSTYYDQTPSGPILSRLTFNVQQVTNAATNAVTVMLREGVTVLGLLGYMFYENWKLTLIFLSLGPIVGLLVSYVTKRFRRLSERIQTSMGEVTQVASETVNGYRVVRIFGGESYESKRFRGASQHAIDQQLKLAFTEAISTPVIQVVISVSIGVLVWLALSPEVMEGMSTGEFIAFITAATTCAKPIRQLTQINSTIQSGIAASTDIFGLLEEPAEPDHGTFSKDRATGTLEFRNITFQYPGSQEPVLKNVSLQVKAGQTVAFVGRSGSGKTTLVSLVPRFYELQEGDILLDGVSIKDWALDSLRKQISLVNQQVTLFDDELRHNVAYGELAGESQQAIEAAVAGANAEEFVQRLPEQYATTLGDDGVLLSGGQRQRVAIARALLKDAPLLILDEATSALDTHAEEHIQQALENVTRGRTTLVIAHRLSTIEAADCIVVMDQGEVVETGTHAELLAKNGSYAALHRKQRDERGPEDAALD